VYLSLESMNGPARRLELRVVVRCQRLVPLLLHFTNPRFD
jgi:hypothetical protein